MDNYRGGHAAEREGSASSNEEDLEKSGIRKPAMLHWLRHSYATHLLECGTDLRYMQELPGHKRSKAMEIYTHRSMRNLEALRRPFDDL